MPKLSLGTAFLFVLLLSGRVTADTISIVSGTIDLNRTGGFVAQDGTEYLGRAHLWTSGGHALVAMWSPVADGFWESWKPGQPLDSTLVLAGFRIPPGFETTGTASSAVMRVTGATPQLYWGGVTAGGTPWGMYGVAFEMEGRLDVPSLDLAAPIAGWGFAYLGWQQPKDGGSYLSDTAFAFGRPLPPAPTPEPSSLTLVLIGTIAVARAARQRRRR